MGLFKFPEEVFVYKMAVNTGEKSIFYVRLTVGGMDRVRGHKLHSAIYLRFWEFSRSGYGSLWLTTL